MAKKLWFKAKRYGWGWTPATWQGWAVTGGYLFFVVSWFIGQEPNARPAGEVLAGYLPRFVFLTLLFVFIAAKTGEKPRWRWGK